MKRYVLIAIALLCTAQVFICSAQRDSSKMTPEQRKEWLAEYRRLKHDFLAKELDLTSAQKEPFFKVYDEMEDKLNAISDELRLLEEETDKSASDVQILSNARALYEQRSREGAIEMEYFDKFAKILQPRQLLKLKSAERKFAHELVKYRRKQKQ